MRRPRGRGDPVLHASSTRPSRRSRRRSRACSSRSTRRSSWARAEIREVFRSSKIGNIAGCIVRSGVIRRNAKARLLRDGAVVADNLTISSLQAVQGRRHRGPRGLRVWSDPGRLQQHPGRRHHRDLRDAGEAARLTDGDTLIEGFTPTRRKPLDRAGGFGGIVRGDVHRNRGLRPAAAGRLPVAEGQAILRTADRGGAAPVRGVGRRGGRARPARSGRDRRWPWWPPRPAHVREVLDSCERLVAGRPEIELLSVRRRLTARTTD